MFTFTISVSWVSLLIGFLVGSSVTMFGILTFVAVIEKKCTCDAWKTEGLESNR